MMGSWKGRGNQYIEFARVVYCKLPTNGKQLPAFPLEAVPGTEPWPQRWEALLSCRATALAIGHEVVHQKAVEQLLFNKTLQSNDYKENSIRDARTPEPEEIFFNFMRYRSSVVLNHSLSQ